MLKLNSNMKRQVQMPKTHLRHQRFVYTTTRKRVYTYFTYTNIDIRYNSKTKKGKLIMYVYFKFLFIIIQPSLYLINTNSYTKLTKLYMITLHLFFVCSGVQVTI